MLLRQEQNWEQHARAHTHTYLTHAHARAHTHTHTHTHTRATGARTIPITYLFVLVTLPLSYPISVLLDWLLEKEISNVYTGRALLQLIRLNVTNPQVW